MEESQVKLAIFIVWIILGFIILLILTAPFILSIDTINAITPTCEWKTKYGRECILCGMTTAFINISKGNFMEAFRNNNFSIYLYSFFVVNEIALIAFVTYKLNKIKSNRDANKIALLFS